MITVLGKKYSQDELKAIELTRPSKAGSRWKGIGHYELVTAVKDELTSRKIEVVDEQWAVSKNMSAMVGGVSVRFKNDTGGCLFSIPDLDGMTYALGISHSNNMQRRLRFAAGVKVMVCLNGVVTGSYVLSRRHTTGVDLKREVAGGVDRFIECAHEVQEIIGRMKSRELTQGDADHFLVEAGRKGLMPWSRLGKAEMEYRNPDYECFRPRTAWSLYNSFNVAVKDSRPAMQIRALDMFRDIVLG